MKASLTDPWFEAEFYGKVTDTVLVRQGANIEGAQGLWLWCPCAYGNNARAHGLIVPFANPRNAPPVPASHGPHSARNPNGPRPRWHMVGTSLTDLTLSPSIAVGHDPECWHGFIRNGVVT